MRSLIILLAVSLLGLQCSRSQADNTIIIDQIGSYNATTVTQDGNGHTASVKLGATSDVDYTTVSVLQQGNAKTASVEIKSGVSNTVGITQEGTGNHTASIINLNGTGNNISVNQSGAGNHELKVDNWLGSVNNGNTITAVQSGGIGADKWFAVNLNGAVGARVDVQQTSTTPNQASMLIQCNPCGNYQYRQ
jgi:hypothetical protein